MIAQLISPHHLSTPSHLVYTCKEHFVSDTLSQVPLSYKLKLPLPVIHLPFVRARQAHLILKIFFCMALSSSLVFFSHKENSLGWCLRKYHSRPHYSCILVSVGWWVSGCIWNRAHFSVKSSSDTWHDNMGLQLLHWASASICVHTKGKGIISTQKWLCAHTY